MLNLQTHGGVKLSVQDKILELAALTALRSTGQRAIKVKEGRDGTLPGKSNEEKGNS